MWFSALARNRSIVSIRGIRSDLKRAKVTIDFVDSDDRRGTFPSSMSKSMRKMERCESRSQSRRGIGIARVLEKVVRATRKANCWPLLCRSYLIGVASKRQIVLDDRLICSSKSPLLVFSIPNIRLF